MRSVLAAALALCAAPALAVSGTVVAVGGALADDNAAVFRALIDAMPEGAPGIVVIPAASGSPAGSASRFADALSRYGVARDRVDLVRVALVDDPETEDTDESQWHNGANDPAEIAKIERAGVIWFSGGDQARIIAALVKPNGSDTPMLAAIRRRLADGAVVGGTSAGAAVLGEHMIGCGSPEVALVAPVSRNLADCAASDEDAMGAPLVLTRGLGFVDRVVFDQHFSQRGRLGRLVRAAACIEGMPIGIGVDEDTGIVIDLADPVGRVVGRGTVTSLHAAEADRACDTAVLGPSIFMRRAQEPKRDGN